MIRFTFYGKVRGKGRPRATIRAGYAHIYTDEETSKYEVSIKESYLAQCQEAYLDSDQPLMIAIAIYQEVPKSYSKKKKVQALERTIRPTKKPDVDNIAKSVMDALNKVAYADDTQIVDCSIRKWYGEREKIEVTIKPYEKEE